MTYVELQVTSNYSFLRGASHVEELLAPGRTPARPDSTRHHRLQLSRRYRAGASAGGRNSAFGWSSAAGWTCADGTSLLVAYPTDRACLRQPLPPAYPGQGAGPGRGLATLGLGMTSPPTPTGCSPSWLPEERRRCRRRSARPAARRCLATAAILALTLRRRLRRCHPFAYRCRISRRPPPPACPQWSPATYCITLPERRILQDVVTCIREGCHHRRRRLQAASDTATGICASPAEVARLYNAYPERRRQNGWRSSTRCPLLAWANCAINTRPRTETSPGETAQTNAGARSSGTAMPDRYPHGAARTTVERQLHHELSLIGTAGLRAVFPDRQHHRPLRPLARTSCARDEVRRPIPPSATCSASPAIDPVQSALLFERFISVERREPPDIDVDFEARTARRSHPVDLRPLRPRQAPRLCATIVRYRARGAVREVGKALGLTEDVTAALAGQVWGWSEPTASTEKHAEDAQPQHRRPPPAA